MNPQIERIKVTSLREYERNARTHPRKQVEQVARSIKEFGFELDPKYCAVILERMTELGCSVEKEGFANG